MKHEFLPLKILSAAGMFIVIFPMLIFSDIITTERLSAGFIAFYYGLSLITAAIGYFTARTRHSRQWKSKTAQTAFNVFTRIIGIVLALLPPVIGIIFRLGAVFSVTLGLTLLFGYFVGYKFYCKSFSDIYTAPWLAGYVVEFFICFFLYQSYSPDELVETGKNILIYSMLIEVLITAVLINQTNISVHTNRRKGTKAIVPKGLRVYNMGLIALISVIFAAIYTLRNQISYALYQIYRLIVWLILKLMASLSSDPVDVTFDGQAIADEAFTVNEGGEILNLIIKILFIGIVISLLIIFRKNILSAIKSLAARFNRKDKITAENEAAFTDCYENIVFDKKNKRAKNSLKAAVKAYRREQNPEVKYRLGYRSFMIWMKMNNIPPNRSDTAYTHLKRSKDKITDGNTLSNIVEMYNLIRYSSAKPTDENLAEMDRLIEIIK